MKCRSSKSSWREVFYLIQEVESSIFELDSKTKFNEKLNSQELLDNLVNVITWVISLCIFWICSTSRLLQPYSLPMLFWKHQI